mgnify:CR=1 FL=1
MKENDISKIVLNKSIIDLRGVHFKQLLTYMRLSEIKLGLLINFNESLLTEGNHRIVNNL